MATTIKDDPFRVSNRYGYVAFAGNAKDSRRTNVFINLADNFFIDYRDPWATPFGRISKEGMQIVEKFYGGYSKLPDNEQPDQRSIAGFGNHYLEDKFPKLTEIVNIELVQYHHSEL